MSETLKLSLTKEPFDLIFKGIKKHEFRKASPWIESRLYDKEKKERTYKFIEFTNGYGNTRPGIKCEFKGFEIVKQGEVFKSNKSPYKFPGKTYAIKVGKIIDVRNIDIN